MGRGSCAARAGRATSTRPAARTAGRRCSTSPTPSSRPPTLARELLARGADPNVTFSNEYGEMSALYGAAGVVHDPELTRVLLEAGADPDDGESVYHATEAASPACLRAADRPRRDARADPPRARARRRAAGARPAAARRRRRRDRAAPVRRPPRPRAGRTCGCSSTTAPSWSTARGGLAQPRAAAHRLPARACCATPTRPPQLLAVARRRHRTSTPTTSRSPRSPAASAGAVPEPPDYDQQEVLILAALRGQLRARDRALRPRLRAASSAARRGPAAAPRRLVRRRGARRFLLAAGADPAGGGRRWPPRSVRRRRAPRSRRRRRAPGRGGRGHRAVDLEQADGPLAAWLEDASP